jgi:hypothetical protein
MFQWKMNRLGAIVSLSPEFSNGRRNGWVQLRIFYLDVPVEGEMAGLNCESFPRMFQLKVKLQGSIVSLFQNVSMEGEMAGINCESFPRMF